MTDRPRLLAHLSARLATHPENIAVEALAYILAGSPGMREAFMSTLNPLGIDVPSVSSFRAQVSGLDAARPDLAGFGPQGDEVVLVEAKFWAGLTGNQPVTYLDRLVTTGSRHATLVVISPALRIESLWTELVRIALESGRFPEFTVLPMAGLVRAAHVGPDVTLVQITWGQLLETLLARASADGDTLLASDVLQLQSLAAQMDEEAFLPIRADELGQDLPRRISGLTSLISDVVSAAVTAGVLRVDGLRVTPRGMGYGRYARMGRTGVWFGVSFDWWARYRPTPLWLEIRSWNDDPEPIQAKRTRFVALELSIPPRLIAAGDALLVPLFLPTGVERGAVQAGLLSQLMEVAALEAVRAEPGVIDAEAEL